MDLSALTIQQLRYVVAVDRHRSFREAARSCHVSQPALSTQVKKVEEMLGFVVFDRTRLPACATERGALVITQARLVLEQIEHFADIVQGNESVGGSYRLGVIPTLASTVLPRLLPAFVRAHPRVELEIAEEKTEVILRRLRDGSLDGAIAITPLDVPGLHERVVCHEAFMVYLPPRHRLLEEARVRQAQLVDEHVWLLAEGHCFRTQALHLCSLDRRRPEDGTRVVFDANSFETLMKLVDAGLGVTIVPELLTTGLSARATQQLRRFAAPEPVREISFLVAREHVRRAIGDALYATMREAMPEKMQGRQRRGGKVIAPMAGR